MTVPPREAADTLRAIQRAQQHSAAAYHYQKAAPHLLLWGVIWIVGYAATYAGPRGSLAWPPLIVLGVIGDLWISRRSAAQSGKSNFTWRYAATMVAVFLFFGSWTAIVPPANGLQLSALFPILIGFCYVILGVWTHAARIALLGLALGALTLAGFFWLPGVFLLWMAGVGGGALILGGLWLRRA